MSPDNSDILNPPLGVVLFVSSLFACFPVRRFALLISLYICVLFVSEDKNKDCMERRHTKEDT